MMLPSRHIHNMHFRKFLIYLYISILKRHVNTGLTYLTFLQPHGRLLAGGVLSPQYPDENSYTTFKALEYPTITKLFTSTHALSNIEKQTKHLILKVLLVNQIIFSWAFRSVMLISPSRILQCNDCTIHANSTNHRELKHSNFAGNLTNICSLSVFISQSSWRTHCYCKAQPKKLLKRVDNRHDKSSWQAVPSKLL